jgi:hypothetical protein
MSLNQYVKDAAELFITAKSGTPQKALNDSVVEALRLYVIDKGGTVANRSINDLVNQATAYYFAEQSVTPAPRGNDAIFQATGLYLTAKSQYVPASLNERLLASANYVIANGITGGPPLLSIGGSYNGTALSGLGGSQLTDATRTTAKPAIHWLMPSDLRLVSNIVVGVDADANGGISKVTFNWEGGTVDVTTPSFYVDTSAKGTSRVRWGYWVTLNAASARAISETGASRLFAIAYPSDVTMQARTIGITSGVPATDNLRGDYALTVYPRAASNDWVKTVAPTGADYTTIAAAITAARAASAEAPLITITATGSYELTSDANNYANGKGFCTITTSSGVTATLGRASAFAPSTPASWPWLPGWDGIEFRGSGIVFDQRNWSTINTTTKPTWFNGCKFTNSIGTLYSYYWNGGIHPGFGASNANYWDDVTIEHVSGEGLKNQRYIRGCTINQYSDDLFTATHYVADNYVRFYEIAPWIGTFQGSTNFTGLRINGPANATVSKTAGDAQGGNLLLRVSGSTVATIALGYYGNDTNPTIDAVVTAINAYGNGWSASAQNSRGTMRPSLLGTPTGNAGTFTDLVASTTLNLNAGSDFHADWWQGFSGGSIRQNVIIRNNTTRDAGTEVALNATLFMDMTLGYDIIIKGNVWAGTYGVTGLSGPSFSHVVYENNTNESLISSNQSTPADTVYSSNKNNAGALVAYNAAGTWTDWVPYINNSYLIANGNGPISGGSNSGNFTITKDQNSTTYWRLMLADYANGDYRPKAAGELYGAANVNLRAKVNTYDGTGFAYAATDVVGARSKDGPAPSYPF